MRNSVCPIDQWTARTYKTECVASFFSAVGSMLFSFNGEHAKFAWALFFVSELHVRWNGISQTFFSAS